MLLDLIDDEGFGQPGELPDQVTDLQAAVPRTEHARIERGACASGVIEELSGSLAIRILLTGMGWVFWIRCTILLALILLGLHSFGCPWCSPSRRSASK
jgi:hypothetical protein